MRLSDAIALGRVLIEKPDRNTYCGCAIGMGLAAKGYSHHTFVSDAFYGALETSAEALKDALMEWPWLDCCNQFGVRNCVVISNWFYEVCKDAMTLDELIDEVRAIEPPEPDELSTQPSTPAQRQVAGVLG